MTFLLKYGIDLMKMIFSFVFAWRGVRLVLVEESNMRVHLLATVAVVIAGFFFQIAIWEWVALVIVIGMVWIAEIFNTAFERLVDMVAPNFNEKAGLIKDIAAGGVLISAILAVVVGILIFGKHLLLLFS